MTSQIVWLTDNQWQQIKPLLPKPPKNKKGGRPWTRLRVVFETVVMVQWGGGGWKSLPKGAPSRHTCWRWLERWETTGAWEKAWQVYRTTMSDRVLSWNREGPVPPRLFSRKWPDPRILQSSEEFPLAKEVMQQKRETPIRSRRIETPHMQRRNPFYRDGVPSEQERRDYLLPLGQLLRQARQARGWSYRRLAKEIGKDCGTWCRLEHAKQRPRLETLKLAATGLGLDFHDLMKVVGPAVGVAKPKGRHV